MVASCPHCGASVTLGHRFCGNCGVGLVEGMQGQATKSTASQKKEVFNPDDETILLRDVSQEDFTYYWIITYHGDEGKVHILNQPYIDLENAEWWVEALRQSYKEGTYFVVWPSTKKDPKGAVAEWLNEEGQKTIEKIRFGS